MPIYNSKDLMPFVNQLEAKILDMSSSITEWDSQKYKLNSTIGRAEAGYQNALIALVRADEAMSEIGTATFTSTANRGKRLEDTLNKLKEQMYEIAANVEGGNGGGSLTSGVFYDELNNAIASVDATIEDGLKLDYRLRLLSEKADAGILAAEKELIVPYKHQVNTVFAEFVVPEEEGVIFIEGDVTVLDENGEPILDHNEEIIVGKINASGHVVLTNAPGKMFTAYFPVEMAFKEVPKDFLYLLVDQMIQKNSRVMQSVMQFESTINDILEDITYMKGVRWTPDYSIMRNHQEIVKEGITPKGLNVEVKNGIAHVTFSHNDHPNLSHFILEKWNEDEQRFQPYDGVNGIIQK